MIALIKQTGTTQTINYMHRDQLGSTTTITDESGNVIERLAYVPFGKRRQAGGATDSEGTVVGINTDRGFTNHEHLEELGLIHMNGRVYDPALGRFMSADPYIQAPDNIQSYNRYAYVTNRPLGLTDPSGYLFGGVLRVPFIDNAWNNHVKPLAQPLLSVAAAIGCTALSQGSAAAACIGIAQTGISKAYGANWGDAIKNGVIAGASTYAFQQINAANFGKIGTIAASAGVGCVSAATAGGNCQAGALAAGFSAAYDRFIGFSKEGTYAVLQNMVVGGTASVLGGGKFQNGAVTAAFRYVIQQGYLRDHDLGRSLAANEIADVRGAFGDSIDVSKVRIFSTQWMALQGERTAMTPDGNIYFPLASSCEDLTLCANGYYRDVFMHEMGHVMQHQSGVNVIAEALPQQIMYGISFGHYNPYLSAEQYRNISDPSKLNVESQADWYKFRSNDLRYR